MSHFLDACSCAVRHDYYIVNSPLHFVSPAQIYQILAAGNPHKAARHAVSFVERCARHPSGWLIPCTASAPTPSRAGFRAPGLRLAFVYLITNTSALPSRNATRMWTSGRDVCEIGVHEIRYVSVTRRTCLRFSGAHDSGCFGGGKSARTPARRSPVSCCPAIS